MIWPWQVRAAARRWQVPYVEAYYRLKVIRRRRAHADDRPVARREDRS